MKKNRDFQDDEIEGVDLTDKVVLRRADNGSVWTNVPHLVMHHSPDGFEWGYGGSGPADLALNVLEAVLRKMGYGGGKSDPLWDKTRCFALAWDLHQEFKWKFIATCPNQGTEIPYSKIVRWLKARM